MNNALSIRSNIYVLYESINAIPIIYKTVLSLHNMNGNYHHSNYTYVINYHSSVQLMLKVLAQQILTEHII